MTPSENPSLFPINSLSLVISTLTFISSFSKAFFWEKYSLNSLSNLISSASLSEYLFLTVSADSSLSFKSKFFWLKETSASFNSAEILSALFCVSIIFASMFLIFLSIKIILFFPFCDFSMISKISSSISARIPLAFSINSFFSERDFAVIFNFSLRFLKLDSSFKSFSFNPVNFSAFLLRDSSCSSASLVFFVISDSISLIFISKYSISEPSFASSIKRLFFSFAAVL